MDMGNNIEAILANLTEGLYIVDRDRRIVRWNRAAENITGYSAEEVVGSRCSDNILIHVDDMGNELCMGMCPLAAAMDDDELLEADVFLHHKQGHRVPVHVRVFPFKNQTGEIVGGIELFSNTGSLDLLQSRIGELEELALMDTLTRLPNRRHIEARIESQLALLEREGVPFSVVFADVDNFKVFNDQHGHKAGDDLLKTVGRTMAGCARPFDTIGRWGGDEFVGVLPNCNLAGAEKFAERACMLVRHSRAHVGKTNLRPSMSAGVAVSRKGDSISSIISRADVLMYEQKRIGGDGVADASEDSEKN